MSCWKCTDCGHRNCDTDDCLNPKCNSHLNKKDPLPTGRILDNSLPKIDTFVKGEDQFSTGFGTNYKEGDTC